jgi:hypothetical protein
LQKFVTIICFYDLSLQQNLLILKKQMIMKNLVEKIGMKSLSYVVIFAVAVTLTGCVLDFLNHDRTFNYKLDLIFIDDQGNDLVKGIELEWYRMNEGITEEQNSYGFMVNSNVHKLDIIHLDPNYSTKGWIFVIKENDYWRLRFEWNTYATKDIKRFLIKLKCPYIFDDSDMFNSSMDGYHEFITYCEPVRKRSSEYKCYRIEYEGKEINVLYETASAAAKNEKPIKVSTATIILDR